MCEVEHFLSTNLRVYFFRRSHWRYSVKKLILKILQDSQENHLFQSLFFNKVTVLSLQLLKKRLWHRCFLVSIASLQNTTGRLLLLFESSAFHCYIFHKSNAKPPMIRNSYETRVFLEQAMGNEYRSRPSILLKLRLQHRCFPDYFGKFLRAPFLYNISDGCF